MKAANQCVSDVSVVDTDDEAISAEEAEDVSSDQYFPKRYRVLSEQAVSLQKVYVLHLDARFSETKASVIAGLSDFGYVLYDLDKHLRVSFSNPAAHEDVITGVKFTGETEHSFYTSSLDGTVKQWDTRTYEKPSLTFKDDTDGADQLKPISCFDISCDGQFVCAGTPLVEADSYLLFWDVRKASVLGGYWEAHTDDITQVRFNPVRRTAMLSASTDGLINVYDVSQSSEDDALENSLNVESSVRRIDWIDIPGEQLVGCITDMETVQLWRLEDACPFVSFTRKILASTMYLKSPDNAYVSDMHTAGDQILLIGGSSVNKGEYLKSMAYTSGKLQPSATFEDNKQLVRCSCYDRVSTVFLTAGESGIVSAWTEADSYDGKTLLKERVKKKRLRS